MTLETGLSASQGRLSRNSLAHLLMVLMTLIWGTMFVMVKEALRFIPPQWLNSLRMVTAFLCLAIVYRSHFRRITRTTWLVAASAGGAMACGFFFQAQGLLYTSATNSAFITAMVVVMVPFLASIPGLRSPGSSLPPWTAWVGALLAFWGVALLTTPAHTPWMHLLQNLNRGDLLTFLCALGFSLQIIALDHGAKRTSFEQVTLLQVAFAMVFLTAGASICAPGLFNHPQMLVEVLKKPIVLGAIAATGILATALAFAVQTWAQSVIPPTNIAVIVTLEPVFATLTAFVVLHEGLPPRRALGALLVLLGLLAAELMPRWRAAVKGGTL